MNDHAAHRCSVVVDPGEIDFMDHVNNAAYLGWIQRAVLDHWRCRVPTEIVEQHRWVAVRHEITYRRPAYLADPITVAIRLTAIRRESAFYETLVLRGEEILAEATSRWCCIDAVTRCPVRVTRRIIDHFAPAIADPPADAAARVSRPRGSAGGAETLKKDP